MILTQHERRGLLSLAVLACFIGLLYSGSTAGAETISKSRGGTAFVDDPNTPSCFNKYLYAGEATNNYTNQGIAGYIEYESGFWRISDDGTDHVALYNNSSSENDSAVHSYGFGWLQAGYFQGSADGKESDTTVVFSETNDLNVSSPQITLYPGEAIGTHRFGIAFTNEYGYGGRGLFDSLYTNNQTQLGLSYLLNPDQTSEESELENLLENPGNSAYCPISGGYVGTEGNESYNYDSDSETYIQDDNDSELVPFVPGHIAGTGSAESPYTLGQINAYDAFSPGG